MNEAFAVRRILVAIEAGTGAPEALEAAAELAHRLDAELEVLVVENVDLLRASGLPFARQVTVGRRGWEQFEVTVVEQEMRAFSTRPTPRSRTPRRGAGWSGRCAWREATSRARSPRWPRPPTWSWSRRRAGRSRTCA